MTETFVLKPGHRVLILNLPDKFKEYFVFEKKTEETNNTEEIPKNTSKKNKSELTIELVEKLEKCLNELGYTFYSDTNSVTDFVGSFDGKNRTQNRISRNIASCRIQCAFCEKKLLCNYEEYWMTSNIKAHFKNDIKKLEQSERKEESDYFDDS